METGLDAGCADMRNRRFFNTRRYIALDPDAALLKKGKTRVPEAEIYNCTILDAPALEADFVHCIQVFVNADFKKQEAIEVTRKLISMVRPGGVLLMNTGQKTIDYDAEIKQLLESAFDKVTDVQYGDVGIKDAPIAISFAVASILYFLPFTRLLGGHSKTYFRCVGRKLQS